MKARHFLFTLMLFVLTSCCKLWDDFSVNISKINWDGVTNNVYYIDKDGGEFSITGTLENGIVFPYPAENDWFYGVLYGGRSGELPHRLTFSFTAQANDTGQDREIEIHFKQELLGFDRGALTINQSH